MKKPLINNQIRAKEVRVIGQDGKQLGVLRIEEALKVSREHNLDLIQITEKVDPPVCKILDYGKYLYRESKEKKPKPKTSDELKGVRLTFKMSEHDMGIKANLAEKFLKKGHKVKIELILRGREKALGDFAKEKFHHFLDVLKSKMPIKIEKELKREARGFTMIISPDTKKETLK